MSNSPLQHVIYVFGKELVAWALNLTSVPSTDADLNTKQKRGLNDLAALAYSLIPPNSAPVDFIPSFLRPDEHWAELRAACGAAAAPPVRTDDPLANSLLTLADLSYPVLLVATGRNDGRYRQPFVSPPIFLGHPANQAFLRALKDDPLGSLFTSVTELEGTDYSVPLRTPFVKNLSVQRPILVSTLLRQAWMSTVFRGTWDQDSYRQTVLQTLATVRSAHQGLPTKTSLFLGFSGCALPKVLHSEGVSLRPFLGGPQLGLIPDRAWPSQLGGTNTWLGFIAEIPVEYFLTTTAEPGHGGCQIGTQEVYELTAKWGSDIALAVALAGVPSAPLRHHEMRRELPHMFAPACSWYGYVELIDQNGMGSATSESHNGAETLTEERLEAAAVLLQRIRSGVGDNVRIAAHRVLMGAQRPRHAEDRLVDAVIAWENIAGETRDAITLKVCAVLAHLVAETQSRAAVRNELEAVYRVRNEIVHGLTSKIRTEAELWPHANRALDVALRAIRALFSDRSDLLAVKKRFEHLYLGGG